MIKENEIISKVLLTIAQYKGNVSSFKNAICEGEYTPDHTKNFTRSLIWKTCLITETLKIKEWDSKLSDSRVIYHKLTKNEEMIVPWWDLDTDNTYYQTKELVRKSSVSRKLSLRRKAPMKKQSLVRVSDVADPLSSQTSLVSASLSPSSSKSATPVPSSLRSDPEQDLELLQSIIMDIDRIFPGDEFFHSNNPQSLPVKRELIQILYVWSKCNPQVGYKQGIHEILGLIYINLYNESIHIPSTNTISTDDLKILSLYDIRYLSHDMFTIFNKFMIQTGIASRFYENESVLWKSIEEFNINLMKVDQLIHYNLITKLKLESQLWIIRYLRLLLLRELGNDHSLTILLWDKLISVNLNHSSSSPISVWKDDQTASNTINLKSIPDLIIFIIIILLIQIKTDLITCDFSESLSLLLHYPISEKQFCASHINNMFKYAVKLYEKRDQDLKLYEFGLKLNSKYNPNLKIQMSYNGTSQSRKSGESIGFSSPSPSLSPAPSAPNPDPRAEKMAFEKYRLEMRLKKKAQSLMRP